jgi:hypothetical protein
MPWGTVAGAGELLRFDLQPEGDGYRLRCEALIEAPKDAVRRVLTDYPALQRVSPRILESELVAVTADGSSRVRTLNRLCFLALCRELRHVQLIRELAHGAFASESVAAESDLSRGHARWVLSEQGPATRLDIDFRFAMDSHGWVPPVVTRLIARSALKGDAQALIEGIERAVHGAAAGTGRD